jgi:hypothetical protein
MRGLRGHCVAGVAGVAGFLFSGQREGRVENIPRYVPRARRRLPCSVSSTAHPPLCCCQLSTFDGKRAQGQRRNAAEEGNTAGQVRDVNIITRCDPAVQHSSSKCKWPTAAQSPGPDKAGKAGRCPCPPATLRPPRVFANIQGPYPRTLPNFALSCPPRFITKMSRAGTFPPPSIPA